MYFLAQDYDQCLKLKPKSKRGQDTLNSLCQAAEALFAETNYYETSVSEIVRRAGTSIGTFYIYFNDKATLYKFIVLQCGKRIRKYIAARLGQLQCSTQYEMEREGIKAFLDFCRESPGIFPLIWQSLQVMPELFINYYDDFGARYAQTLVSGIARGDVRPVNVEAASYMLMGISNFIAHKYVIFRDKDTLSDEFLYRVVDDVMDLLKNGLFRNP